MKYSDLEDGVLYKPKINWLPTKERIDQRVATKVFKYRKWALPFHLNELFPLQKYV